MGTSVDVEVVGTATVTAEDWDDDDLIDALEHRGYIVFSGSDVEFNRLVDAFKLKDPFVVDKCKQFLQVVTGRII